MIKRTVEIAEPSYLRVRNSQLKVERDQLEVASIPFDDLGVLILAHPRITITQAVLAHCASSNIALITCDHSRTPTALSLPISGHVLHARILARQSTVGRPFKERLWRDIIRAKLLAQSCLLGRFDLPGTARVARLAQAVKAGDPGNLEAQAAKVYWRAMFGSRFRRNPELPGVNALLNYGYAVIRAATARAIVSAGLHPALGIHHCNQYNSFALADDLMEPYRPFVDGTVRLVVEGGAKEMCPLAKRTLVGILARNVRQGKRRASFFNAIQHVVNHFRDAVVDRGVPRLSYPSPGEEEFWSFLED